MKSYYIYIYLDPRKSGRYLYENFSFLYKPFYVGKGINERWKVINGRTPIFINKFNKIKKSGLEPIIIKLYENLNEEESLKKEIELIDEIGRIELGTGPLLNMTDGGEGNSGYIFSEETKKLIAKKQRKNFLDIKKEFERRGYILLTEEKDYKNNHQKLKYICPKGHEGSICWNAFQKGCGCQIEGNENRSKKQRKNFLDIKKEFEKREYILLSENEEYKDNDTKLNYICPEGHKGSISWNHFQKGCDCSICYNKLHSEKIKGENGPNSILITQDVIQIKLLLEEGKLNQKEISDIFGVSLYTISDIKRGKTWAHIKI